MIFQGGGGGGGAGPCPTLDPHMKNSEYDQEIPQSQTTDNPIAPTLDPHMKNSEYDQEIPQSQTTDNPIAPRGRAAQPSREVCV